MRVGILLTCGKHVYDCIMSLIGEVHKPSLTPPLFIKVSVLSQESGGSCICVLGITILSLSPVFHLDFGTVRIGCYFVFHYLIN